MVLGGLAFCPSVPYLKVRTRVFDVEVDLPKVVFLEKEIPFEAVVAKVHEGVAEPAVAERSVGVGVHAGVSLANGALAEA